MTTAEDGVGQDVGPKLRLRAALRLRPGGTRGLVEDIVDRERIDRGQVVVESRHPIAFRVEPHGTLGVGGPRGPMGLGGRAMHRADAGAGQAMAFGPEDGDVMFGALDDFGPDFDPADMPPPPEPPETPGA